LAIFKKKTRLILDRLLLRPTRRIWSIFYAHNKVYRGAAEAGANSCINRNPEVILLTTGRAHAASPMQSVP
jgi:hypothetical protein